jgi:hypothetical protein
MVEIKATDKSTSLEMTNASVKDLLNVYANITYAVRKSMRDFPGNDDDKTHMAMCRVFQLGMELPIDS